MRKIFIFVLLVCCWARAYQSQQRPAIIPPYYNGTFSAWARLIIYIKGTNYVSEVRWEDARGTPEWDGTDKPPLSADEAGLLAVKELSLKLMGVPRDMEYITGMRPWTVIGTSLRRCGGWASLVLPELTLLPSREGGSNSSDAFTVFVTLGGHVIGMKRKQKWANGNQRHDEWLDHLLITFEGE